MNTPRVRVSACATATLCVLASTASANLVTNAGFEHSVDYLHWPNDYGVWGGDKAHSAAARQGITPLEGSRMLQFDVTSWNGTGSDASSCQICQPINTSSYQALIRSGEAVASARAYFNRVAGDSQTDTKFMISIFAYSGGVANHNDLKEAGAHLARQDGSLISDFNPATWELGSVTVRLPAATDFIVVQVSAVENIYNDFAAPEFDGHYADDVELIIVPEPTTLLLLCLGGLVVMWRRVWRGDTAMIPAVLGAFAV